MNENSWQKQKENRNIYKKKLTKHNNNTREQESRGSIKLKGNNTEMTFPL